jgi:hypothetical protein
VHWLVLPAKERKDTEIGEHTANRDRQRETECVSRERERERERELKSKLKREELERV